MISDNADIKSRSFFIGIGGDLQVYSTSYFLNFLKETETGFNRTHFVTLFWCNFSCMHLRTH